METDSQGTFCPFDIKNGVVEIIEEHGDAYLIQVVKNEDGTMVKQTGRYFIIPKVHKELLIERPDTWTRDENILLAKAFIHASQDRKLMELMRGRRLMDSLNMSWNRGKWAGQRVLHIHNWVLFRYDDLQLGLDGCISEVERLQARMAELEFGKSHDLATPGLPH